MNGTRLPVRGDLRRPALPAVPAVLWVWLQWVWLPVVWPLWGWLLAASPACAGPLVWNDSDWSGGRYQEVVNADAEVAPGLLVLANRLDDLRLVGKPTWYAGLYSMAVLHDTLFITASNYPYMYDGAEVIAYDLLTNRFQVVYEPYESGLHEIKRIDDQLYVPGPDSRDPHEDPGSIYTYDGITWIEKATLPTAVHVNDVERVNGRLYATTGHATGELHGYGCVWVSDDDGETFQRVLSIAPTPSHIYRRFYGAGRLGDRLFVQPDGYAPEGGVVYSTRNGTAWEAIPVPGMPVDKQAVFTPWGDSLLMTISDRMFIWDGEVWHPQSLPFGGWRWCRGIHVHRGELYGGGDSCRLFRWLGDSNWEPEGDLPVDPASEEIESIATCYGRLFVSTSRLQNALLPGLFVCAVRPEGSLESLVHDFGTTTERAWLECEAFVPAGGAQVRLQVRWADAPEEIGQHPYVGPDGTSRTWFGCTAAPLPPAHAGARCYQYRAELRCPDGMQAPLLRGVELTCYQPEPGTVHGDDDRERSEASAGLVLQVSSPVSHVARIEWKYAAAPAAPVGGELEFMVFNARGATVRSERSVLGPRRQGAWSWDLRSNEGRAVAAGVYFVSATARCAGGGSRAIRSVVVVR